MALCAVVVRAQRIHLRDARHGRDKGRAHGTSRADEVPVLVRFPDELLRDDIHDRVAVLDDGTEFLLETVLHDLRQLLPVHAVSLVVADITQLLIRVLNDGRALVRPHRAHRLHLVRNLLRVGDDDLLALVRSEIGELLHHLIGCPKIERSRFLLVRSHAHGRLDDRAVDLILRIKEVNISGRNHRRSKLFSEGDHLPVQVQQILFRIEVLIPLICEQEPVVVARLNFQIIIESHDLRNPLL